MVGGVKNEVTKQFELHNQTRRACKILALFTHHTLRNTEWNCSWLRDRQLVAVEQ